ncbi:MAG: hypothetical protein R3F39_01330 [Myxococcota bacterium]
MTRLLVSALVMVVAAGCAEVDQETSPETLAAALAELRGPEATTRATADPLPAAGAGPHLARHTLRWRLDPANGERMRLVIARTIERGEGGRFKIRDSRVWQDTRIATDSAEDEATSVFDGKRLAVSRNGGPWMERETLGGHEERLLRTAYDLAPTLLDAFGPYLIWKPAPPEAVNTVAGMEIRWEDATLDSQVRPRPMSTDEQNALRDHEAQWKVWLAATHRPTEVSAHIARRVDGGEIVMGSATISGEATVEGVSASFKMELSIEISELTPGTSFDMPDPLMPAQRERPWKRIRDLLGADLLAPYNGE